MNSLLLLAADNAEDLANAAEHATGHAGTGPTDVNLMPAITTLVVFLVAFAVLARMVWPKIAQGLEERERKILDEIESAEAAREAAQNAQAEYEASLLDARKEAAATIAQAKADAKAAGDELKARNETQLTDMKQRAMRDIETAKQAAISDLRSEAAGLATVIAGKILQREISVQDQQQLVDESLAELGSIRNN